MQDRKRTYEIFFNLAHLKVEQVIKISFKKACEMKLKAAPVRLYMPYLIFAFLGPSARRHLSQKIGFTQHTTNLFFLNKSFTITRNWVSFIYYPTEQSRVQITRIKTSDKMYISSLNRKTSNSLRGWYISIKVFFSTKKRSSLFQL